MTSEVKCCLLQQNLICLPRTYIYTSFKPAGVSVCRHASMQTLPHSQAAISIFNGSFPANTMSPYSGI